MVLAIWVFVIIAFAILAAVILAFNNFEAFILAVADTFASTNNAAVGTPVVAEWTKHMFEFAGTVNNLAIGILLFASLLPFIFADTLTLLSFRVNANGTPKELYLNK